MQLSAAELAAVRADLDTMLPDVADVLRYTETPDGGGSFTVTYPQAVTAVACRLSPASGSSALKGVADRIADETTHIVTLTAGTDARARDRIRIGLTSYEVLHVRTAGAWELARHALVRLAPA